MNDLERLLAMEDIQQVKAKYFYGFDTKNWAIWRDEVWAPDAQLHVPELREEPFAPRDEILEFGVGATQDLVSVHHGHNPIIEFVSDWEARVIWSFEDRLYRTKERPLKNGHTYLHGLGHYHETYIKLDQGWRLQSCRITRMRVETRMLPEA